VVEKLLEDLELGMIPCLRVYNKIDRIDEDKRLNCDDGICISAIDKKTLAVLHPVIQAQLDGRQR